MSRLWVVEHKTSSEDIVPGSTYYKRLRINPQITNYIDGARIVYGREPDGVIYDVVKKIKLEPYKATPREEWKYTLEKSKACPLCKKALGRHPFARSLEGVLEPVRADDTRTIEEWCEGGRVIIDRPRLYSNIREHDESLDDYRLRVREEIANNPDKYYQRAEVVRMLEEERDAAFDNWQIGQSIRDSQNANVWPRNPSACEKFGSFCDYWGVCTREARIDDDVRFETVPPRYEGKHLPVLSTSSANTYRACQKRYFYENEMRRRLMVRAHALRFGTLFHCGLEAWWKTVSLDAALEAIVRASTEAESEVDQVDLVCAEELMGGYHFRWKDEPMTVLGVEVEYHAPLVNPATGRSSRTWIRGGKMDAVIEKE